MTKVRICETEFNHPDGTHPDYSLVEVDVFGYIPAGYYSRKGIDPEKEPSFSLSLRKNLKTGKYEVFKWHRSDDESTKEVIFSSNVLKKALKKATELWHYYWDDLQGLSNSDFELVECQHEYPEKAMMCHA